MSVRFGGPLDNYIYIYEDGLRLKFEKLFLLLLFIGLAICLYHLAGDMQASVSEELLEQELVMRQCVEQLESCERSHAMLCSDLKDALHVQVLHYFCQRGCGWSDFQLQFFSFSLMNVNRLCAKDLM